MKRLLLFDFQTQKWNELAVGSFGWANWTKDGQYLQFFQGSGNWAVIRIRISDGKRETVLDLKDIGLTGRWGHSIAIAPDDSPLLLREAGTQDVYSLDWEEP